ncbi:beta-galactosidase [Streptomyces sp. WMMC500]|uniref:beta-galactosidase n=1 Tax=Streptomyces sp. WMMC500 TaxID=3015154 RepID=UPI00248D1BD6|nr:beta-galactosidase [Streptomyces sp. WMMC500]WBB59032.1 beta-galactosidase [Streptomyces sp. WMMC500]
MHPLVTRRHARPRRALAALLALAAAACLGLVSGAPAPERAPEARPQPVARADARTAHTVSYDRHSLIVDGERVLLQGAEFHYFRLPSPDTWRDVLEKYKAAGFNTVSLYFHWGYHSPKRGVYDFSGVRDVDRLLDVVEDVGLYAVVRPGPYINAETSGGGLPAWLKTVEGRARSSDAGYTAAYREWLTEINRIIVPHQVTRGGPVVLYNVENEYAQNTDAQYMQDLQDLAHAQGVDVPVTHNQCCQASWTPHWAEGLGAVDIPGLDDYPQSFECQNADTVWGPWGDGITRRLKADAPVYAAEYQGGAIDLNNAGYEACRKLTGPAYMKYFYKSNLIRSGATLFSYYMGFGGTNWGYLAQPNDVYTSYDYGAMITEDRQLTEKYDEFKLQSHFLRAAAGQLAKTDEAAAPASDNPALETAARVNPDTGARFTLLRHADPPATTDDSAVLDYGDGRTLPVRLDGRDAKVLLSDYAFGGQRLALSSSELMTHTSAGGRDVALLYGREGEAGRTVLEYGSRPGVEVLDGAADVSYAREGDALTLDYVHEDLTRVRITGGGRPPLLLLLGTDATAAEFWQDAESGLLVRGTALLRDGAVRGGTALLRADTERAGEVEVFTGAGRLAVNGDRVPVRRTASGSLLGSLPGPRAVEPPELTGWRAAAEAPEARPDFDDSRWRAADRTLHADDHGFHHGSLWYRGRFTATGAETGLKLNAITGRRGIYQVWADGRYLGSAQGGVQADSDPPVNEDPGPGAFTLPDTAPGEEVVVAVLVQNMGHNDDWIADDTRFKQPRGLVRAELPGSAADIAWRIQGTRGGEDLADTERGPFNNGGLYGERHGWHLPQAPASGDWRRSRPDVEGGTVTWYRTSFRLGLPHGQDTALALRFGEPPAGHRLLMYVNGWNVGQYGAGIGPQRDFTLPAGLLRDDGRNTVALAVVAEDDSAVRLPSLVVKGNHRTG